jgi:hypothetical protein
MAIKQEFPPLLDKGPSVGAVCTGVGSTSSLADVGQDIMGTQHAKVTVSWETTRTTSTVNPVWSGECCSALGVELEEIARTEGRVLVGAWRCCLLCSYRRKTASASRPR